MLLDSNYHNRELGILLKLRGQENVLHVHSYCKIDLEKFRPFIKIVKDKQGQDISQADLDVIFNSQKEIKNDSLVETQKNFTKSKEKEEYYEVKNILIDDLSKQEKSNIAHNSRLLYNEVYGPRSKLSIGHQHKQILFMELQYYSKNLKIHSLNVKFTEDNLRNITYQLINGLLKAHEKNICHRDLKPQNLLIDSKGKYIHS